MSPTTDTTTRTATVASPLGLLTLVSDGRSLTGLSMEDQHHVPPAPDGMRDDAWFAPVVAQLEEYFAGRRTAFEVPLGLEGTAFQRRVWEALLAVPYGETVSYGELARRVGVPGAARAVGSANGRNPVALIVPCHRVIGADGSLGGYGGGTARKSYLLGLEAAHGPHPGGSTAAGTGGVRGPGDGS